MAAASALIGHNPERLPKRLRAAMRGPAVEVWRCGDGAAEADAIAREAARLAEEGFSLSSIAILCRTNAGARPIAAALLAAGVPHLVVGGHGFHERPEVKDLIAMLRVVRDPTDLVAMARVAARPATVALQPLLESFAAAAQRIDVRDLFFELMERTRYLEELRSGLEASEAARATANVTRFGEAIAEFCETTPDHSLDAYLQHLELVLLSGEDEQSAAVEEGIAGEAIIVMTIHQSKGLEFDAVFVPSLVEGRLPQSGRSPRFELRRSCSNLWCAGARTCSRRTTPALRAMTRARTRLYLTFGEHYEGGRRWRESRFLKELGARRGGIVEKTIPPALAAPVVRHANGHVGEVVLSYSAIAAYHDCPRQYWYRHVQRLPVVQSAEAAHGVILHEVLRQAGDLRRRASPSRARR